MALDLIWRLSRRLVITTYNSNNILNWKLKRSSFGEMQKLIRKFSLFSQFPYNTGYGTSLNHRPSNPNPTSGWFVPNNVTAFYQDCDGLVIEITLSLAMIPIKYVLIGNYLKSIQNTKPELFFCKAGTLICIVRQRLFHSPNCIKFDPVFQTLCGITKIVDVSVAFS